MVQVWQLDEDDIKSVVAHHFDTSEDKVSFIHYTTTEGYGLNERDVKKIRIVVEKGEPILK